MQVWSAGLLMTTSLLLNRSASGTCRRTLVRSTIFRPVTARSSQAAHAVLQRSPAYEHGASMKREAALNQDDPCKLDQPDLTELPTDAPEPAKKHLVVLINGLAGKPDNWQASILVHDGTECTL